MSEHAEGSHPYYKIFAVLTVLTILEIFWARWFQTRGMLAAGLSIMAAAKASLVGLYYMHLKYERHLLWLVALFPVALVIAMIAGLLPDAVAPY